MFNDGSVDCRRFSLLIHELPAGLAVRLVAFARGLWYNLEYKNTGG
jgi:hypothetical protein